MIITWCPREWYSYNHLDNEVQIDRNYIASHQQNCATFDVKVLDTHILRMMIVDALVSNMRQAFIWLATGLLWYIE